MDAFVTKAMTRSAGEALDALFVELEMRGHRVQLSPDYGGRPPMDVAQRPSSNAYDRASDWQPNRPTIVYVRGATIGITLFERSEHVKVRRRREGHYIRISDLPSTHRYAPQSPGEADETRDMASGRLVLRAYSPHSGAPWQHEWTESERGELVGMVVAVADALEEVVPKLVRAVEDAQRRDRERRAQFEAEERRRRASERIKARGRARQAARDELRAFLGAWTDAGAREAFFKEVARRAEALGESERADLEARVELARDLTEPMDAVDRFLKWRMPAAISSATRDDADNCTPDWWRTSMATGANKTIWWDFDGTLVWRPFMWAEVGLRLIDRLCPGHGISAHQLTDALASGMPWHRDDHAHPDLETATLWWKAVYDRYAAVFSSLGCARVLAEEHLEALRTDILDASRYTLFDDAVPVLSRLQERGWRQIIVSNHVPELGSLMAGLGLVPYFEAVVSSGVVGYEKPHRRLFEAALAETPPGSRIWMIGDNIDCDCRPVAAFGAEAILVCATTTRRGSTAGFVLRIYMRLWSSWKPGPRFVLPTRTDGSCQFLARVDEGSASCAAEQ